jgi:hypothetical protein
MRLCTAKRWGSLIVYRLCCRSVWPGLTFEPLQNNFQVQNLDETGLWEITPGKSASVYECFRFIWPCNARALSEVPWREKAKRSGLRVVPGRFR